jgi:DNA replication protein DnaC
MGRPHEKGPHTETKTETMTAEPPTQRILSGSMDPMPATCPNCGSECQSFAFGKATIYECDPCANAERAKRRAIERRSVCLAAWVDITPPEFQKPVQPDLIQGKYLLPALDLSGTEGAGLIGPTGHGKTRVAYALLRKAALAGLKPYAVTGAQLRQAATMRTNDTSGKSAEILRAARYAGALLLDDVGKGSVTEAGDEALFALLDDRLANRRVTFWTSNSGGEWIAARYKADRGPAIARRLANLAGCFKRGTGRIFSPIP